MEAISPQESSLLPGGFAPSDLAWLHLADCRKATLKRFSARIMPQDDSEVSSVAFQ